METQLMYVISIVLGVAFGYFVASMMFRNERNALIAQGQKAGEAELARLAEQAKSQETRVAEIEKEREQERAEMDRLREQNERLKVLHAEADERVNEARRTTEEYWQQVVAEARTSANGGAPPVDIENSPEVQERIRQAVEAARQETGESWQRTLSDVRAQAEDQLRESLAEAREQAEQRLAEAVAQARQEAEAAVAPAPVADESHWQKLLDEAREQGEQRVAEAVALARQEAEAEWSKKLAEAATAASAPAVDEAHWQKLLDEAREQGEQRVAEAVALARQEAEAEWSQKVAAATAAVPAVDEAHWQKLLDEAREQGEQRVAEAVALVKQEAEASYQATLAEEQARQEDLWQQALAEARRQAEFEREQAAGQAAEAESRIQALTEELNTLRRQAAETAPAAAAPTAAQAPDQSAMIDAFRAVATEALNANNQKFLDLARIALERIQETARPEPSTYATAMSELMGPIRETLAKVDSNIGQLEKERQDAMANLTEMVTGLVQQGKELRRDTSGLARALHPLGGHGRWSEVQLRRVVELAGMVEHCDYEQRGHANVAGGQPEMIVHLPNHRDIVVDASVSLTAYLESLQAGDEAERASKLREHAASIRAHLQKLSGAAYWSQFASTPEFVVAFLPNETVFSAALEEDPSLLEFGAENRVILATPTTLIALLKATAYGWRQQQLADNANTVRELGRTLYARLNAFTGHLDDLRRNLERSVESYNRSVASLESRVLVSARRFQDLTELEAPEIPVLEPVETLPRSLHALESATIRPEREFEEIPEIGAAGKAPGPVLMESGAPDSAQSSSAGAEDIPVIELPIVPPMAPVIVCEPRVVSEAHVVSEPRVVREPNFVAE